MGCLNSVTPRILEVLIVVFTIIGIGFLIWGIIDIPWDDISTAGKVFFYIGCGLMILVLLFILVLMCLRIGNKINESKNRVGKCFSATLLVFNVIALIIFIISEIIIFINMSEEIDDYYYNNYEIERRRRRWDNRYSNEEWFATVCSVSAAEIVLILNIVVLNYLIKVIWAKCNICYNDYLKTQKNINISEVYEINNNTTKAINLFNSPPATNQNVLTFIGYDKNGHPIYSGSTQYFTQNNMSNKINADNNVVKK